MACKPVWDEHIREHDTVTHDITFSTDQAFDVVSDSVIVTHMEIYRKVSQRVSNFANAWITILR